jgi:hypothetical protein
LSSAAPSKDEAFFRTSFRHVNNFSDPAHFSIHLFSESSIHIPGIFIHILSEFLIHMPRNPQKQNAAIDTPELDAPTRAVSAFRTLSDESRLLDLMGRYESRFERQFNRALDRLERLKKEK